MKYTILAADDQIDNIIAILNMLTIHDKELRIIGATNGKMACDLALLKEPDLIILDWEMPVMTGIDAVRFLKTHQQTKDIPIIMATALTSSEHLQEAMSAGAMDYIRKPIDRVELIARVKSALLVYDYYRKVQQQASELRIKNAELKKLSIVASETDNSVIIIEPDGTIEWANDGFSRMYGYTIAEYKAAFGNTLYEASKNSKIADTIKECIEKRLSQHYVAQANTKQGVVKYIQTTLTPIFNTEGEVEKIIAIESDITKIKEQEVIIMQEKEKSDNLLLNILPNETARELKEKGYSTPRLYKKVSVLFTDFKGFTKVAEGLTPQELVDELHMYFAYFDDIMEKHFIEKIKTIGDAYMCAGGLPIRNKSHPIDTVLTGLEIQRYMKKINEERAAINKPIWQLRCGIHTGAVIAGVVGKKKFAYDIWGDTVNIASRMESSGEVGKVNISEITYSIISPFFECEYRGKIDAKNKGKIDMYFVTRIKPEFSEDRDGIIPNEQFLKMLSEM